MSAIVRGLRPDYRPLAELAAQIRETILPDKFEKRPYLALEHIDAGDIVARRQATPAGIRSAKFVFRRGDVLYGRLRPYLDKAVLAPFDGLASTELLVLRPRLDVDPQFLAFAMHSRPILKQAIDTTAGVNHPRTSWESIRVLQVYCPPIEEQRRIARILLTIQQTKAATQEVTSAAVLFKRKYLQRIFGGDFPAVPMREVASVRTSFPSPERLRPSDDGEMLYLKVSDLGRTHGPFVTTSALTFSLDRKALNVGATVFPKRGGAIGTNVKRIIGKPAVIDPNLIAIEPGPRLDERYLFGFMEHTDLRTLQDHTPIPQLNKHNVDSLLIPLPPIDEQRRVARTLSALDAKLEAEHSNQVAIGHVFSSTLQSFFGSGA